MARLLLAAAVRARWRPQTNLLRDGLHAEVQWLQPRGEPALGQDLWIKVVPVTAESEFQSKESTWTIPPA